MNILLCRKVLPLCPSPKRGRPIHPRLKRAGLSGPSAVRNLMLSAFLTKMSALSLQKIVSLGYPCYSRYPSYRKGQDQMDYLGRAVTNVDIASIAISASNMEYNH